MTSTTVGYGPLVERSGYYVLRKASQIQKSNYIHGYGRYCCGPAQNYTQNTEVTPKGVGPRMIKKLREFGRNHILPFLNLINNNEVVVVVGPVRMWVTRESYPHIHRPGVSPFLKLPWAFCT